MEPDEDCFDEVIDGELRLYEIDIPDSLSFCGSLINEYGTDQFVHLAEKHNGKRMKIYIKFMEQNNED